MFGVGAIISGLGAIASAVSGPIQGWFTHKTAKVEAERSVEVERIRAGVEVQKGSFKDEWLTVLWTAPFALNILGYPEPMNRVIAVIGADLYAGLLMTITAASFGVQSIMGWKAGKLEREITWDRHEKNGKTNLPAEVSGKKPVAVTDPAGNVVLTDPKEDHLKELDRS